MKKHLLRRSLLLTLCAALLLTLLAGCGPDGAADATPTPDAQTTPPATGEDVPDWGQPDYADLAYLDAIAAHQKTDWAGNWIWTKGCSEDSYVAFRKTVTAASAGTYTAYISAVDKYTLWLNGELVVLDGSLKRGPTPYDSYYDTVELPLQAGENTIALLVAFNGRSGDGSIVPVYTDKAGDEWTQAGLLFEMDVDGTKIVSDPSWKAIRHNGYKNRVTGGADYPKYQQSSMLAERNVYFDAREDMDGWNQPGFDDSGWENAAPVAKPGGLPFGALYDGMTDVVSFGEITDFANSGDYVGTALAADTTLTLPFPHNCQFTFYFELEAAAGQKLTIYTDTYADPSGLQNFKDTYVTRDGLQSYENYPWRSGTQLIIEAPAGVTFKRIGYRLSQFATERTAFTSDQADLDQLWQESQNTVLICMRDTFMDCPERERGPYMGDASNEIDAALYCFDQNTMDLIKRSLLACVAWTKNGQGIPSRAPSVKPQEIPNQSLALITTGYHYWQHTGDVDTMTAYYRASVDYLKLFEMENGLPVYRPGTWTWDDWGSRIDKDLLQVGFYFYALRVTDQLGDELGINADKEFFTARMAEMKAAYHDAYYTPDGFKSSGSQYIDERGNALLALSGLAGEEDYDLIANVIATTYQASPFAEKYVLEAACAMGRTDVALKRMRDRYAGMLADEYDTLWEYMDSLDGTINHGWTAAPAYILSKYIAGVRPTSAGFETWEVAPSGDLDSFSCETWTPMGMLKVTVETTGRGRSITVESPGGVGSVVVPAYYGSQITVTDGDAAVEGNTVTISAPGTYTIIAE